MTEIISKNPINRSLTEELKNHHISSNIDTHEATNEVALKDQGSATMSTVESEKDAITTISEDGSGPPVTPNKTENNSSNDDTTTDNMRTDPLQHCLERRDNCYILPKCVLPPRKHFAPVEKFVATAVQAKLGLEQDANAQQAYKAVMDAIRRKVDLAMLEQIFLALRTAGNGSTLHQLSSNPTKHAQLLHFLLRFDPFCVAMVMKHGGQVIPDDGGANHNNAPKDGPSSAFALADAYFHLILALVSANSVFLIPTMTSLWKLLTIVPTSDEPSEPRVQRLHATLAAITRLVPKGKTEIFPIMSSNFPFRTNPEKTLIWCYRQCFAVIEYVPSNYSQVLQFVIDKCLEMDVEIKIHDGGEVTLDDEKDENETIFELELDAAASKKDPKGDITVDEMADKLDALMLITFELLERTGSHDVVETRNLYERCLPAFESSILITHRSKFVQFILFYLCGLENKVLTNSVMDDPNHIQQHATLYREYAANLIQIIFDPYRATLVRQKAACYLASFVSRANFVESDTVCESLCALLRWADAYIASLAANSISAADARNQCELHALFYTVCQAAFYIMCFRGAEAVKFYRFMNVSERIDPLPEHLQDLELDHIDISPARWKHVCNHGLNPLRYCLETVREEFLRVAKIYGLLDERILHRLNVELNQQKTSGARRKKKASLISTTLAGTRRNGGVGGMGQGSNPLDSFFPFDPYLLRRSHPFIEPFYRNWSDQMNDDDSVDMIVETVQEDEMEEELAKNDDGDDSGSDEDNDDDDSSSSSDEDNERFVGSYDGSATMASTPPRNLSAPRQPWTETLKRERAPSIENGSW